MSDSRRAYEEEFGSLPTNSQERKKDSYLYWSH